MSTGGSKASTWFLVAAPAAIFWLVVTVGLNSALGMASVFLRIVFSAYFLRHLCFAVAANRAARTDTNPAVWPDGVYRPPVTVVVSCHNEESVVEALAAALVAMVYPSDLLQIILVNDGSSDATAVLLDAAQESYRGRTDTHQLTVLHRPAGSGGGKSGALNHAARYATGEVLVVYDADHEPKPESLGTLITPMSDPSVGAVMGRCVIKNPESGSLATTIAIDFLSGYLVNEYGRQALFELPAYGGANCAVRASVLHACGGWNQNSVTEDTDITMRVVLMGQKVRYVVSAIDREEAVTSLRVFWRQRYRWARGHQQVWRDYRGAVLRSRHLPLMAKVETFMFLLCFHIPAFCLAGLALVVAKFCGYGDTVPDPIGIGTLMFAGPLLEIGTGLLVHRAPRRTVLTLPLFIPAYVVFMVVCTRAWLDGVLGRPYTWAKTARQADAPLEHVGAPA